MPHFISGSNQADAASNYDDLIRLFGEWREFERPPLRSGAPDYTAATLSKKQAALKDLQRRLESIDPSRWPVGQQIDYHLVRAEMNAWRPGWKR